MQMVKVCHFEITEEILAYYIYDRKIELFKNNWQIVLL